MLLQVPRQRRKLGVRRTRGGEGLTFCVQCSFKIQTNITARSHLGLGLTDSEWCCSCVNCACKMTHHNKASSEERGLRERDSETHTLGFIALLGAWQEIEPLVLVSRIICPRSSFSPPPNTCLPCFCDIIRIQPCGIWSLKSQEVRCYLSGSPPGDIH